MKIGPLQTGKMSYVWRQAGLRAAKPIPNYKGSTVMFGVENDWSKNSFHSQSTNPNKSKVCWFGCATCSQSLARSFFKLYLFIQDNTPPNTSRVEKFVLETESVAVLRWPFCSSDLDQIEHLSDKIKMKIRARQNKPGDTEPTHTSGFRGIFPKKLTSW